jgi:uncharacterized membrane protein YsdA (DUF1294 family)/cold shock CspA family protein
MSQRHTGTLVLWDDDRGYGFIESDGIRGRIFAHIRDFDRRAGRPAAGDEVTFHLVTGREGKPAAWQIEFVAPAARPLRQRQGQPGSGSVPMRRTIRVVAALMFATAIIAAIVIGAVTLWYVLPYLLMGPVTFGVYWFDKRASEQSGWRVPEATLHAFDLCFGIVGGLFAQGILRHKTSKPIYTLMSTAILIAHIALLGGATYISGSLVF